METVVVLDYGMSNLRSVAKALEHVSRGRHRVVVSGTAADLERAERVVFPGQGAIGECMSHLGAMGILEALHEVVHTKPFLGICLGLQALMDWSAEGNGTAGLGVCSGRVLRFTHGLTDPNTGERLKIPHMGWNAVSPTRPHPLWAGIAPGERFYFVHSYYVAPEDQGLGRGHHRLRLVVRRRARARRDLRRTVPPRKEPAGRPAASRKLPQMGAMSESASTAFDLPDPKNAALQLGDQSASRSRTGCPGCSFTRSTRRPFDGCFVALPSWESR